MRASLRTARRAGRPRTVGFAAAVLLLGVVLCAGGCSGSEKSSVIGAPGRNAGPTEAQLAELRRAPAGAPVSGPRVPELFTIEDAKKLTGLDDIRILACTG